MRQNIEREKKNIHCHPILSLRYALKSTWVVQVKKIPKQCSLNTSDSDATHKFNNPEKIIMFSKYHSLLSCCLRLRTCLRKSFIIFIFNITLLRKERIIQRQNLNVFIMWVNYTAKETAHNSSRFVAKA